MLDVVPPQQAPRAGRKNSPGLKKKSTRSSVVELDWRLPARLRRPVRHELQRQRRRRRQREAIVRFERRPLYKSGQQRVVNPATSKINVGAEHHTGDVYRDNRPRLSTAIPPYAGSFLRGKSRPVTSTPAAVNMGRAVKKTPTKPGSSIIAGERDIPYQWTAKQKSPVVISPTPIATPARSRFALPIHVSVWPFKRSAASAELPDKKKVQNSDSLTL